jgi:TolA-binding protein
MGKNWVRNQIRHDEVHDVIDKGILWVTENRQKAGTVAGVVALVALIAGVSVYRASSLRAEAWDRLNVAESMAYSGRPDASLEAAQKLAAERPNSDAAGFATVFAGDLLYQRGQYKEAAEHYAKVIERGSPKVLQPVALQNLALAQEASGQPKEAAQTVQRFIESFPDHFLAPQAHSCLARSLEATGQTEPARATLQKIALQYPDSVWAMWAQNRLKGG